MGIPTVFFDMDGTLVDSMYYWNRAPSCVLAELGFLPDDETEADFARLGFSRIPEYVAERFPAFGPKEAFLARIDQWMLERYRREVLLKPNVREYLQSLRERGIRCAILTASAPAFIETMLERYRLKDYFSAAFSARQLGIGKGDPAIYPYLFEQMQCTAADCVLFDDSLYAVTLAAETGLRTAGVLDPLFPQNHQKLREICTCTFSRYSDLLCGGFPGFAEESAETGARGR